MGKYMTTECCNMKKFFAMNPIHFHRRQNVLFRQEIVEFLLNSNFY